MNTSMSTDKTLSAGTVYTETVVYSPPETFAADAPYQLAIVALDSGGRVTARIDAHSPEDRVKIGDRAEFIEFRKGIPFYRKAQ
ncbi:MAG: OB-fold domain-containing protein [Bryobacteraceae bacterium]|nr:OB-fold domain-containing protein [Bryobacteraceae bacterium]